MKRKVLLFFMLCGIFNILFSQNLSAQKFGDPKFYLVDSLILEDLSTEDRALIDSSLTVFHKTKSDTSKIHAVVKIIDKSWNDKVWPRYNEWMMVFTKKCLLKENDKKTVVRLKRFLSVALNNYGVIELNKGNIDLSLKYLLESLEIERQYAGEQHIATSLSNIGYILSNQGDIPKALDYYHQGLAIQEKYHDSIGISRSLNNIGFIYQNLGDSTKALEYYNRSLSIREKTNDRLGIAVSLSNIAEIYDENGNYKKAIDFYEKGNEIYKSLGNLQGYSKGLNNVAYIFIWRGDPYCQLSKEECRKKGIEKALEYCSLGLDIQMKADDKFGMSSSYINLARIQMILNNVPLATEYANRGYQLSLELGFPDNIRKSVGLLKELSYNKGNYKAAYDYFIEEIAMRDSLEKKDNYKLAQKKQAKYFYDKIHESDSIAFAEQKRVQEEIQKAELKIKEKEKFYLYLGVIVLMVFIGFLYNRFKITNRQKKIIEHQKIIVEEKNMEVLDSINYAKGIQDAIMPSRESLNKYLKNGFVLYMPKDIIAGDFYWMDQNEDFVFVAAADCTGHGVPGAIVSVVCSNALNRAVKEYKLSDPGLILDKVREIVIETFSRSENEIFDGMDISFCAIYKNKNEMLWAGANNPLWIWRNSNLLEFEADKQPVGKYYITHPFHTHKIVLEKNDILYLFSDGYADQFGGEKGKKFKYSNLKKLFLDYSIEDMATIKDKLESHFHEWKGELEQIDDVCIIGIKI